MTPHTYRIVTAPDGVFWVPLQPLLRDLQVELASAHLTKNASAISRIEVAVEFVDALISEGNQQLYSDEVEQ